MSSIYGDSVCDLIVPFSCRYNLQLELLDSEEMEHPLPCNCLLTKCILAKACLEQMETV